MSGWLKIGVEFIKTLAGQWNDRPDPNAPRQADKSSAAEGLATGADSIAVRLESQMSTKGEDSPNSPNNRQELGAVTAIRAESQISIKAEDSNQQELGRRREIVRQFLNDFWSSTDDKPTTFTERLNQAEDYINERLTACGEAWLLDSATRKQLGLPAHSHRE
jgi:hypothetical protein